MIAGIQQIMDQGPNWTEIISCLAAVVTVTVAVALVIRKFSLRSSGSAIRRNVGGGIVTGYPRWNEGANGPIWNGGG